MDSCLELDLSGKNLAELDDLSKLKHLKILDASCNNISRISGIADNRNLRVLKFYGNHIKVIENLGKLNELTTLLLHDNAITAIGKGLMHCHKIQTLRLDHNHLRGVWSGVELASCAAHLSELDLSYNRLIGAEAVGALSNLVELNLAGNKLQLVPNVERCLKLATLNLSSNPLQCSSLSNLKESKIKILHLSTVQLDFLSHFPHLPLLQELHLSYNHLSSLDNCETLFPALEVLDVRWNRLKAVDTLYPLAEIQSLTELMVNGNELCSKQESLHSCIRKILPNIEMVDSHMIQESISMKTEELITTSGTQLSEVAQALIESDHLLEDYKNQITTSFRMLQSSEEEEQWQSLPRPQSRSSNRARLEDALEFAAHTQ